MARARRYVAVRDVTVVRRWLVVDVRDRVVLCHGKDEAVIKALADSMEAQA